MNIFKAPYYTEAQLEELSEKEIAFPFSDKDATYVGLDHQYELTSKYFQERGRNLEVEVQGNQPDKVKLFLTTLRRKFYSKIYNTNKSTTVRHVTTFIGNVRNLSVFVRIENVYIF